MSIFDHPGLLLVAFVVILAVAIIAIVRAGRR